MDKENYEALLELYREEIKRLNDENAKETLERNPILIDLKRKKSELEKLRDCI